MSIRALTKSFICSRCLSFPPFFGGTLICVFLLLVTPAFAQTLSFDRTDWPVDSGPAAVVVADFNGDGIPDIATANFNIDSVSVLLGNGDGSFQPAINTGTNDVPRCTETGTNCNIGIVAGDLNGDGIPDLVVLDGTAYATVLLGNGDGTFQLGTRYFVGEGPIAIAMADFKGDGALDIAVSSGGIGLAIRLGNGDGTFQDNWTVAGSSPRFISIVATDLNGDFIPDIVTANLNTSDVTVFLGNGDGSFQQIGSFGPVGVANCQNQPPQCKPVIAAGDLNGDGIPDLVVSDQIAYIRVLLGNGDGTFQNPVGPIFRGEGPASIALADFNGDGALDYTAALLNGIVTVGLGNGDGSFQEPAFFHAGNHPASVATGDLNGDGRPDIVVVNWGDNTVSVLINTSTP